MPLAPLSDAALVLLTYVPLPLLGLQELDRGEADVLECDALSSCLYVNEPKVKVDLTKYTERHTFRWARGLVCGGQVGLGQGMHVCWLAGGYPRVP